MVTPEALKVIIAQAMTLAQKAQHMGIRITPPQPGGTGPGGQAGFGTQVDPTRGLGPGSSAAAAAGSAANGQIPLAPQFVPGAFSPDTPLAARVLANAWESA